MGLALLLLFCFLPGCGSPVLLPATPEPANMRIHPPEIMETPMATMTPEPTQDAVEALAEPTATPWIRPVGGFSVEDMRAGDIALHDPLERVETLLGEADIRETYTDEVTGASFVTLGYGGLFLHLLNGRSVTRATLNDDALAGPRGLRVGDSYERVIQVFVRDPDMAERALALLDEEDAQPLTLYGEPDPQGGDVIPPMGVVDPAISDATGQEEFIVRFIDPSTPYTQQAKQDGSYQFQLHGVLVFFIRAEDRTIARINWTYSALAE